MVKGYERREGWGVEVGGKAGLGERDNGGRGERVGKEKGGKGVGE